MSTLDGLSYDSCPTSCNSTGTPNGYTANSGANRCDHCYETCYTCSGPGSTSCTSCYTILSVDYFLANSNRVNSSGVISITDGTSCSTTCFSEFYPDKSTNYNYKCLPCHYTCVNCFGPNFDDCKECGIDRYLQLRYSLDGVNHKECVLAFTGIIINLLSIIICNETATTGISTNGLYESSDT